MTEPMQRLAVFVLVVVVVVAGVVGATFLAQSGQANDTPVEYPPAGTMVPVVQEAGGQATIETTPGEKRILIDTGHANRHDEESLRPLVSALGAAGHEVELYHGRNAADLRTALSGADAFVVIDPGNGYIAEEADVVESFVAKGGRLLILGEPTRVEVAASILGTSAISQHSRVGTLAGRFGVGFGTEYLYNEGTNDGNFKRIVVSGEAPIEARSMDEAVLYTATTAEATNGTAFLVAGEGTKLSDGSDASGRGVAVLTADGNVLAVGDASFLEGNHVSVAENEQLVAALAEFLVGGERTFDLFDYPAMVGGEATLSYTDPALLDATKSLAGDLRAGGSDVTIAFAPRETSPNETTVLLTTFASLERRGGNETGITVTGTQVSTAGYRSARSGVTVITAPESGYDLVIAAETADGVERGVDALASGTLGTDILSGETAVISGSAGSSGPDRTGNDTAGGDGSGTDGGDGGRPTGPTGPDEPALVSPSWSRSVG